MVAKPLRVAADTNVLVDIEDRVEDVLDAIHLIGRRLPKAEWLVTPSVLDELASLCGSGETERLRQSSRRVLLHLRSQTQFRPLLALPFGEPKLHRPPGSDQFLHRLMPIHKVVRPARKIGHGDFVK